MKPKLVRDNIPNIIAADGRVAYTKILSKDEYEIYLEKKLMEEVKEYQESRQLEELADILEVVYAILDTKGCSKDRLELIREQKKQKSGGFSKRLLLYDITED